MSKSRRSTAPLIFDLETPTSAESFKIKIPRLYVNQRLTRKKALVYFYHFYEHKNICLDFGYKEKEIPSRLLQNKFIAYYCDWPEYDISVRMCCRSKKLGLSVAELLVEA